MKLGNDAKENELLRGQVKELKSIIMEAGTTLAALYEDWAEEIGLEDPVENILDIIERCKIAVGYYNDNDVREG